MSGTVGSGAGRTHAVLDSPVGPLTVVGEGGALVRVEFEGQRRRAADLGERSAAGFEAVAEQLGEYFAGQRRAFDLPLAPAGTDWQLRVWGALLDIPHGETRTYGQLAAGLGAPGAARAVGLANGANPLPVVVPCHRVVGAGGALTGFGGGLPRKRLLLDLEAGVVPLVP